MSPLVLRQTAAGCAALSDENYRNPLNEFGEKHHVDNLVVLVSEAPWLQVVFRGVDFDSSTNFLGIEIVLNMLSEGRSREVTIL